MTEVEVWVLVDEDGNFVCHTDRDELKGKYEEDVGELSGQATRVLRMAVNVPTPKPVQLVGTVGEEASTAELKVA